MINIKDENKNKDDIVNSLETEVNIFNDKTF